MSRYRKQRDGGPVTVRGRIVPFTFWPESYLSDGRIVTLDPWRCIQVHIHQRTTDTTNRRRALAFLEQAEDFYLAAMAPRIASKPLLHYYSFLNLAKAYLVVKRGLRLDHCMHGLKEPDDNLRKRLTITSQAVKANDAAAGARKHIYRAFIEECGFSVPPKPVPIKVVDLLEQTVSINGVICRTMGRPPQFFLAAEPSFEYSPARKEVWIRLWVSENELASNQSAPRLLRKEMTGFEEVESPRDGYRCYESKGVEPYTKSPLNALKPLIHQTWHDVWSELVPGGYRFWVSAIPAKKRLAQLATAYQAMFYFGSLTRYRPDDFHKLADGKHGWMVQEFFNTQPLQFVYFLGSGLMDAEMTLPELTRS